MHWLIENVVKPWHPTILGVPLVAAILYFGLPARPAASSSFAKHEAIQQVEISDCGKIKIGMTAEDVQRLLQVPGEQLTVVKQEPDCAFLTVWYLDGFHVFVSFDVNHRVTKFTVWLGGKGGC